MSFIGATRKEAGRGINNDAFAVFGNSAFLLDGAGNARGAARRCVDIVRQQYRQPSCQMTLSALVKRLDAALLGFGAESTFVGIEIEGGYLTGLSCGDSPLWVVRTGQLLRINENTKPRLGTGCPEVLGFSFALKRHDVILAASDGLVLDNYRIVQTVQGNLLRPSEMADALLKAQKDCSDDLTVLTGVVH